MSLNEISKHAEELYNDFVSKYGNESLAYLDYIQQELDMMDEIDDEDIIYSGGHYDEQTLSQYLDARDEDGNYLHPYDKEEFL